MTHEQERREPVPERDERTPPAPEVETVEHPAPGVEHRPEPDAENIMPAQDRPGTF